MWIRIEIYVYTVKKYRDRIRPR